MMRLKVYSRQLQLIAIRALAEASIINVRGIAFNVVAIVLAVIGVWLAIYIMINRPIRALIKSARRQEAGDTLTQFPKLRFSAEFGQLSAALSRSQIGSMNFLSRR